MYITRDLTQIRLNGFLLKRKIWSLFKKAWEKDTVGYKKRCYFYQNGTVRNDDDFNRFIRAIGISRDDLTTPDYDGIKSAWFYLDIAKHTYTITEVQNRLDGFSNGVEYTVTMNIGYRNGYIAQFTDVNGIIDTNAVINDILADPLYHVLNDNVTFHNSDIIEAHLLFDGVGFDLVSSYGNVISNTTSDSPFIGIKASITYKRNMVPAIAAQRTVDILNGTLNLSVEYPTNPPANTFLTSTGFDMMIGSFTSTSSDYIWTFSEFDSLTRTQFMDFFQKNFKTDYEEEDLTFLESLVLFILLIVAVVLALPTGGFSAITTLSAFGGFLGTLTLYLTISMFVIAQTVGMGAIGLLRVFGKILEILGIATAILGIYTMIQRWATVGLQSMLQVFKDTLKVFNTYDSVFGQGGEDDVEIEQTQKENNETFDHALTYTFTKSFETTEIEEQYQKMFDLDQYIHV